MSVDGEKTSINIKSTTANSKEDDSGGGLWEDLNIPDYAFIIIYVAEGILILCAFIGMVLLMRKLCRQSRERKRKRGSPSGDRPAATADVNRLSAIWNNDQVRIEDPDVDQALRLWIDGANQRDRPDGDEATVDHVYDEVTHEPNQRQGARQSVRHYEAISSPTPSYDTVHMTTFQRRATARADIYRGTRDDPVLTYEALNNNGQAPLYASLHQRDSSPEQQGHNGYILRRSHPYETVTQDSVL